MADKITLRSTGPMLIICFGISSFAIWLVWFFMAWFGARDGAADPVAVAATTSLSLKGMVVSLVIFAVGMVARVLLRPRPQSAR